MRDLWPCHLLESLMPFDGCQYSPPPSKWNQWYVILSPTSWPWMWKCPWELRAEMELTLYVLKSDIQVTPEREGCLLQAGGSWLSCLGNLALFPHSRRNLLVVSYSRERVFREYWCELLGCLAIVVFITFSRIGILTFHGCLVRFVTLIKLSGICTTGGSWQDPNLWVLEPGKRSALKYNEFSRKYTFKIVPTSWPVGTKCGIRLF